MAPRHAVRLPVHDVGHVTAVPLHTNGAHAGSPAYPAPAGTHEPGQASHTSHGRLHADSQHTPSTQYPDAHSLPLAHAAPLTCCATHTPPVQNACPAHSRLVAQSVGQLAPSPRHRYGAHDGSPDPTTAVQLPAGASQASHGPAQAVSQQYPSTQYPVAHWASRVHTAPFGSAAAHSPALQKYPAPHCPSTMQLVGHVPLLPLHTYGSQLGAPLALAASLVQLPGTCPHSSHAPLHAVLQQ